MILQDAMRKAFKDAEFHGEYKKPIGEEPDPLMPKETEKAIREMPRECRKRRRKRSGKCRENAEVIELLKKLSDEGPLPAR